MLLHKFLFSLHLKGSKTTEGLATIPRYVHVCTSVPVPRASVSLCMQIITQWRALKQNKDSNQGLPLSYKQTHSSVYCSWKKSLGENTLDSHWWCLRINTQWTVTGAWCLQLNTQWAVTGGVYSSTHSGQSLVVSTAQHTVLRKAKAALLSYVYTCF